METPEFFQEAAAAGAGAGFHYNSQEKNVVDQFIVDELLDFPNDDDVLVADDDVTLESNTTTTTEYSSVDGGGNVLQNYSSNSSFSGSTEPSANNFPGGGGDMACRNFSDGGQFSSELCVPYDDLAELEWLSNIDEESFSSEDLQKLQLISGMNARTTDMSQTHHVQPEQPNRVKPTTIFRPEMIVPAKARSKRSRAPPCNWTSRLIAVSPSPPPTTFSGIVTPTMSSSSESDIVGKKKVIQKKKEIYDNGLMSNNEGRKCLHCATDKTPQWRTGPMGPKTLCNACGVRYKSGRLVPEYRPAASPTFVQTKHSNSHRKVVELRRQKEFFKSHHQQPQPQQQFLHQNMMFDVSGGDDFLIHQHLGSEFRQLI